MSDHGVSDTSVSVDSTPIATAGIDVAAVAVCEPDDAAHNEKRRRFGDAYGSAVNANDGLSSVGTLLSLLVRFWCLFDVESTRICVQTISRTCRSKSFFAF